MARLIDADALIIEWNKLAKHMVKDGDGKIPVDFGIVICELSKTPTVDAVPVVHGIWLVDDYDSGDPGYYSAFIEVHCSKCGYELGAESGQYGWCYGDPFPLNYCPNCGAKMDLEVE